MKKIYKSSLSASEAETRLKTIIELEKEDTLRNHVIQFMTMNNGLIAGNVNGNRFAIWYWGRPAVGVLFQVIKGEIYSEHNGCRVELNSRVSPIGKGFLMGMFAWSFFLFKDNIFNAQWWSPEVRIRGIIALLFVGLVFTAYYLFAYYFGRSETFNLLRITLELEKINKTAIE
jgi:hypothetical protein